jgi:hypothetical protein
MAKNDKTSQDGLKSSIWGGRFSSGPSQLMQDINASINYDKRLYRQDIAGSKAHASMLAAVKIISNDDCHAIHGGLDQIASEIEAGDFVFSEALEDIHMNIESGLPNSLANQQGGFTPHDRAMIRWQPISNYGFVICLIRLIMRSPICRARFLIRPKHMPIY